MKKMVSTIFLLALVLTASFVFAEQTSVAGQNRTFRPPCTFKQQWECVVEDKANMDKAMKAVEDEAEKLLNPVPDKGGQQPRSF